MKALALLTALALAGVTPTERLQSACDAWRTEDWVQANTLLVELLGDESLGDHARAKVAFVQGVVLAEEREGSPVTAALEPFASASGWAGQGQLRLDAIYNGAWVQLQVAEQAYAGLMASMQPAPPVPPVAPGPPVPGAAPATAPEPPSFEELLAVTRAAYAVAKASLIQRLELDWRDEDTRANLEWIQRRLRELDELEQQQQEQEEEENEDGEPSEDSEDSESEDEGEPSEDSEQEPSDKDGEESDDSEESDEVDPGESQEPDEEPAEEPGEEEEPQPGEEQQEGEEQPPQPEPGEPEERFLTKEEMQRLLDRLQTLDEEGERVRAALQRARRVPVDRDW